MKECGNCRAANPDDAYFCSTCGAIVSEVSEGAAGMIQSDTAPDAPSPYGQPGGPPYYGTPFQQQPYPMVRTVSSNGKAIVSMVLGIVGIFRSVT